MNKNKKVSSLPPLYVMYSVRFMHFPRMGITTISARIFAAYFPGYSLELSFVVPNVTRDG